MEVLEEGPRAVIERIEVIGNKTNTAEAVLRYLDLKPGMELTGQLVGAIEDRLWRAARFLNYKVTLGSPDAAGRVALRIELAEYDEAPPLAQAFSPTEEAMLKLREWLSKLDESGEDMIVNLSGFPGRRPKVSWSCRRAAAWLSWRRMRRGRLTQETNMRWCSRPGRRGSTHQLGAASCCWPAPRRSSGVS